MKNKKTYQEIENKKISRGDDLFDISYFHNQFKNAVNPYK